MIITLFSFAAAEERVPVATPTGLNAQTQFFAFFVMKAAKLKCLNRIVYRVCRVEHFKTFRKAISSELGLSRPQISATDRETERDRIHKENYSIDIPGAAK